MIGPTGLVQKIKYVVDQTDSVEILRIALDSKLVPVFQHVWIKDSTDSHELFALLASHTSSRDDFAAYYMSVDDDGSVVGPYSPLMFKRLTEEQRTHIATKAKNWKIGEVDSAGKREATLIDNLRKGKWSTLLLDMFSLFHPLHMPPDNQGSYEDTGMHIVTAAPKTKAGTVNINIQHKKVEPSQATRRVARLGP